MRDLKILFSATIVALVMSALPAVAQTGRIGGTVKDTNGQPIKGATVVAENPASAPSSFTATTDDRGRYSMIGLKAGTWKVTASAPGFTPSAGNVPIKTIGAPMPPVDFTLAAGARRRGWCAGRREHQGAAGRTGQGRRRRSTPRTTPAPSPSTKP